MALTPTKKIWMDGALVDWENATTHVLSHTLHYGMGAFEGIRAYKTPQGHTPMTTLVGAPIGFTPISP